MAVTSKLHRGIHCIADPHMTFDPCAVHCLCGASHKYIGFQVDSVQCLVAGVSKHGVLLNKVKDCPVQGYLPVVNCVLMANIFRVTIIITLSERIG